MRAPAFAFVLMLAGAQPAHAAQVDVVVQAGHQGRPASCAPHHVKACNLGAGSGNHRERDWTPIVADQAAAALRRAGYRVLRRPADYDGHDNARAAVFLHFDGSAPACKSGASVGFPAKTDVGFVHRWEKRYRVFFPFRFVGENFTSNESHYYGFRKVTTPGKSMLIEFGEITCPAQEQWLAPRLHRLGDELAIFLIGELHP